MVNNPPMVFRGARSLIHDIAWIVDYEVIYWYPMTCAAASSSEFSAAYQNSHLLEDNAGYEGVALLASLENM